MKHVTSHYLLSRRVAKLTRKYGFRHFRHIFVFRTSDSNFINPVVVHDRHLWWKSVWLLTVTSGANRFRFSRRTSSKTRSSSREYLSCRFFVPRNGIKILFVINYGRNRSRIPRKMDRENDTGWNELNKQSNSSKTNKRFVIYVFRSMSARIKRATSQDRVDPFVCFLTAVNKPTHISLFARRSAVSRRYGSVMPTPGTGSDLLLVFVFAVWGPLPSFPPPQTVTNRVSPGTFLLLFPFAFQLSSRPIRTVVPQYLYRVIYAAGPVRTQSYTIVNCFFDLRTKQRRG